MLQYSSPGLLLDDFKNGGPLYRKVEKALVTSCPTESREHCGKLNSRFVRCCYLVTTARIPFQFSLLFKFEIPIGV